MENGNLESLVGIAAILGTGAWAYAIYRIGDYLVENKLIPYMKKIESQVDKQISSEEGITIKPGWNFRPIENPSVSDRVKNTFYRLANYHRRNKAIVLNN